MTGVREFVLRKRLDIFFLVLAAPFPIYKYFVSVVMLTLLSVTSIFIFFQSNQRFTKPEFLYRLRYFLIGTGFYLLMICSLLYSSDLKTGFEFLVSTVYILIYPLIVIFFVGHISKAHLHLILFSFVFGCLAYAIYIHWSFFNAGLYTNFRPAEFYDLPFRSVVMTLKYRSGHPTYVSMWFLFAVLFIIHFMLEVKVSLAKRIGLLLMICIFVFSSILLSAKITVIAFFVALLLLIYLMLKNKWAVLISYVFIAVLFISALFNISFLRTRFIDEFQATELKPPVGIATNSLNIRVGIYECSKRVFRENWLIGTGVGDFQAELNKCYASFDTNVYKETTYNTHNNFFGIAITIGTVGLAVFVFMLIFNIKESVKRNNTLFLVFLLFVIICMLPENILSRNHGVVFYSIFCSLFMKVNMANSYQS